MREKFLLSLHDLVAELGRKISFAWQVLFGTILEEVLHHFYVLERLDVPLSGNGLGYLGLMWTLSLLL